MTRRILVPIDGSSHSNAALEHAITTFPDAELIVLHVVDPLEGHVDNDGMMGGYAEGWYENAQERAERLCEGTVEEVIGDEDRTVETVVELGKPTRTIVQYVEENDVDEVVMGSRGRTGVGRILLGSVAESVVRRSPVPVTVVR